MPHRREVDSELLMYSQEELDDAISEAKEIAYAEGWDDAIDYTDTRDIAYWKGVVDAFK